MKFTEKTGKTVEEAVDLALEELGASKEDVEITVLEEASKGLFGVFGKKECRVRVTLKEKEENAQKDAADFLHAIYQSQGLEIENMEMEESEDTLMVRLFGDDAARFIGRRGESMDALQQLLSLVVNKNTKNYKRVLLDIENYRAKREESLKHYASKMARQCARQRRNIRLEVMNPYERRIVHSALQDDPYVTTFSEGKEPYRRIIIEYKRNKNRTSSYRSEGYKPAWKDKSVSLERNGYSLNEETDDFSAKDE